MDEGFDLIFESVWSTNAMNESCQINTLFLEIKKNHAMYYFTAELPYFTQLV